MYSHSRHTSIIASCLLLFAGSITGRAFGDVLSDNLENVTGGVEAASTTRWLGASFATNAAEWRLTSVTLHMSNPIAGTAALELHGNGGLQPGSLIATLNSPATYPAALADVTFTASNITLTPSTTYWIVLRPDSGEFNWAWTPMNTGFGVGYQNTWGVSDDTGAWWSYDIYATKFQVVVAVPTLRGDVNCDNLVDFFDIDAFLLAIFDPPGYAAAYPNCDVLTADVSGDGQVDFFDIDPFVGCLFGSCP